MSKCAGMPACVGGSPHNCANLLWWQRPIYWDRHEEPQDIGDVLFMIFIHLFPFFAAFIWAVAAVGFPHLATAEGLKIDATIGVVLTLLWWYLLYRKE